ncbi:Rne/Rng family ribonuclease [Siccirubricoccus deserti]|uniref:Ribonuclease E n=1 Tax=Siccirubricoccus deserti TaxID=2013562 RepID=A0A9X0R2R4_9PROT|nr:ribonuclease E/G [Siccirubricoccus deserti]MBC4017467.1 Rne/Rng family ribonuclease [Siccirubricoccus deserti]
MTKRMLIDASHAEETRVVVLDGNRLEEFDLEAANRLPLKGNIYLAKVVRVEPSLQAAFVEYGGNRHGFLAFGEIHPDYYQIPIADRQRLLEMQAAEAREEEEAEEAADAAAEHPEAPAAEAAAPEAAAENEPTAPPAPEVEVAAEPSAEASPAEAAVPEAPLAEATPAESELAEAAPVVEILAAPPVETAVQRPAEAPATAGAIAEAATAEVADTEATTAPAVAAAVPGDGDQPELDGQASHRHEAGNGLDRGDGDSDSEEEAPPPETIGGEGSEEVARERRLTPRFMRHYKIQEVIRRRQIMLVQVVKEERGTKGAALTTYISLAGRFSVLMPNSPRGGGVSRKITSTTDRKRLREVIDDLGLPQGMSLIVRTAGAQRPKPEIRRDCEYLLRLWDNIRERTLSSTAPALIYEEADLIKRSIRDVFSRDVEEILVDGEPAYQEAREFMRMLMPQHARKIQLYRDGGLFARHQVEQQLDAMHSPTVQLRSGGYIVINQTEALVAIDVNSGRSTRERHIEDTALRTNLEAADEIARQLRLRDLAGLIVIDFIDMESSRNDGMVERRLKEALRFDRARIQVGRISHFGLLEMSRQRLRPSLTETTFVTCSHCQGRGQVRSVESSALQVLRAVEEEGARRRTAELCVHVASSIALYLLNRKRDKLAAIEARFGMSVLFEPDDTLLPPAFRLEKLRAADPARVAETSPAALRMDFAPEPEPEEEVAEEADAESQAAGRDEAPRPPRDGETEAEAEASRRKRRRRRRRGGNGTRPDAGVPLGASGEAEDDEEDGEEAEEQSTAEASVEPVGRPAAEGNAPGGAEAGAEAASDAGGEATAETAEDGTEEGRDGTRRRRRRRRPARSEGAEAPAHAPEPMAQPTPRYLGPTPADPFAGQVDDILAAMEAAEAAAEAAAAASRRARAAATVVSGTPAAPEAEAPAAEVAPTEALAAEAPAEVVEAAAEPGPAAPPEEPVALAPPPPPEPEPEPEPVVAPEEPVVTAPPPPEPAPEPVAAAPEEPAQGPVVQPVSVDALDPAAPRKRGWWRR